MFISRMFVQGMHAFAGMFSLTAVWVGKRRLLKESPLFLSVFVISLIFAETDERIIQTEKTETG